MVEVRSRQAALVVGAVALPTAVLLAAMSHVREASATLAADLSLQVLFMVILPLCTFIALFSKPAEPHSYLVRFGLDRRPLALKKMALLCIYSSLVFCGLTAAVLVLTRGASDAELPSDLAASLPVALLTAPTVLAFFLAARAWLGRPGLLLALALSCSLGDSELALSAAFPLRHAGHLLGLGPPLQVSAADSAAALLLMLVAWTLCVRARVSR